MTAVRALSLGFDEPVVVATRRPSLMRLALSTRSGRVGAGLAVLLATAVVFGPLLASAAPDQVDYARKLQGPSSSNLLGTDQFGRDQLARLLDGGRRSLVAAVLVFAGALTLGLVVGLVAGMRGGLVGGALMRLVDVMLALPALVLALATIGMLGPGFENLLIALVAASWAPYARITRSVVQGARARPDVIAARMSGLRWVTIVRGHVLPGAVTHLGVLAALNLGEVVVAIAGLSFLGLGAQPPAAEWGAMLSESRGLFTTAPWLLAAPAVAIVLSVMAANLCGDALRDAQRERAGR